jgi:hypothetical protein
MSLMLPAKALVTKLPSIAKAPPCSPARVERMPPFSSPTIGATKISETLAMSGACALSMANRNGMKKVFLCHLFCDVYPARNVYRGDDG